jgi:porin
MAISPMLRGLRSGFGKLAVVSGFALILVLLALPTFALPGDQPVTVDPAVAAPAVAADPQPGSLSKAPKPLGPAWMNQDTLLNWGPARQNWADKGFSFDFHYITDALGDVRHPVGTDETFVNWQRIRGTVDVDFGKFSSAKGLAFHATGVWQNGTNMGGVIGSIANPSGIVSSHQFRLDSIWLSQAFMQNKVQVTAGIMAAQDFYGICCDAAYLAEPMFYNYGNMGNTRTSYDPQSAPAVNLKVVPNKHVFVQTGYFLPSDDGEEHDYPTGFNYKSGHHGATSDTAIGYFTDPDAPATRKSYPGVYQAGYIYNGSKAGSGPGPTGYSGFFDYKAMKYVDGNYLFYVQGSQPVYRVKPGSNRGLDVWAGLNTGPENKSEIPTEFIMGLVFHGPFGSTGNRAKDSIAAGVTYSKFGSDYKTACRTNPDTLASMGVGCNAITAMSDERQYEFNYLAQVFPFLYIQPVVQYYANVGGRNNGSATVAGFRLVAHF